MSMMMWAAFSVVPTLSVVAQVVAWRLRAFDLKPAPLTPRSVRP